MPEAKVWQVSSLGALLAGAGVLLAVAGGPPAQGSIAGKVILRGARPFTESWSQIVRRGAASRQVAIYGRGGTLLSIVKLDSFYAVTVNGETYPRAGGFDPHILFDRRTNRWFASAMDRGTRTNNQMVLAVSRTADPTGIWDKYL